jgi:hypothetical protein
MNTRKFQKPLLTMIALAALAWGANIAQAQSSPTATTSTGTAQPVAAAQAAPQLSYGVPEILQLNQAKVGDSVIINYIQNSGNNYGLNAAQIIYLRQQGISESVINAMLTQRSQSAPAAPVATASSSDSSAAYSSQTSTAAAQPTTTYVQSDPSSTVYVVPSTPTYYYSYPYPYYYPYYYGWPAVSLSFGWNSRCSRA